MYRLFLILIVLSTVLHAQPRPRLVVDRADIEAMRAARGHAPLFDSTFVKARAMVDRALSRPIRVPVPEDAGGTTHERHKQNYVEIQNAGLLYAVNRERRYALFVRDMLLQYARLYPTLKLHPAALSEESGGRLFWQTLNETVWLVHAAQAYDCVYDALSENDRQLIETNVFRPMVTFFAVDHAAQFNRMHNHGTWMVAAVGMAGYALRDSDYVQMAIRGTRKDGSAGFIRQLDLLFSPDGYYTEGPYYARYALLPFFLFASAIDKNNPEMKIFEHRDCILRKALMAAIQQTTPAGTFLPFNDALKEMSLAANEIVVSLNVTFARFPEHRELLSIARGQGRVMLSGAGVAVARALATTPVLKPFPFESMEYRDGADGLQGGVGILRTGSGAGQSLLFMKYAAQGMGHGHFDRLGFSYYDQGGEVIPDYGAVRFINVEPKFGGRYLPENTTWAKQTIAHNALVVDGRSHFDGQTSGGEKAAGERHFFDVLNPSCQVMSGIERGAYPGVAMERTMALIRDSAFTYPIVIDVLKVTADSEHTYELPFYFHGHLVATNVQLRSFMEQERPLGNEQGYQHLWLEAEGQAGSTASWTWLLGGRYYSVTSATDSTVTVQVVRSGASDPNFNLRHQQGVILRQRGTTRVFASVVEPHGIFEPVDEISRNATPSVTSLRVLVSSDEATVLEISGRPAFKRYFKVAHGVASEAQHHDIRAGDKSYTWSGNFAFTSVP
jgi:oligo-alginate lyase